MKRNFVTLTSTLLPWNCRGYVHSSRLFPTSLSRHFASSVTNQEAVVRRYFEGVNETDPVKIRSCFAEEATIRDVCALNTATRRVKAEDLVERCMDFLAAHPDCNVNFYYGPTKGGDWIVAHWYETGTWSGESCGIPPRHTPMKVEGQTRFKLNANDQIESMVVTRTFTDWEMGFQQQQKGIIDGNDVEEMSQVAQTAARKAGRLIVEHLGCSSTVSSEIKTNIKDIVTEHDKAAQDVILSTLRAAYPNHAFLGEEDVPAGAKASEEALEQFLQDNQDFLWICDPIDGTANFASGLNTCAVTLGLVYRGEPVLGLVYDPHQDEMFTTIRGKGAYCNGRRLQVSTIDSIKDSIVNAGCPADPNAFATSMRGVMALNGQSRGIRIIACSALTTAWIAAGRLTAHFGYDLSSWDLVAGALLIHEAGGKVTDLDGSPYTLTTRNMLCSNGLVHDDILEALTEADAVSFQRSQ